MPSGLANAHTVASVNFEQMVVPDACICDNRHIFGLTPIPVVSPTKAELEDMWK